MKTRFPADGNVALAVQAKTPMKCKVRVRIPAWCTGEVAIAVNDAAVLRGRPGTYALLDRQWKDGDTVSFTLRMAFRATRYIGENEIQGHVRYGLEYGPFLMAFVGALGKDIPILIRQDPKQPATWLKAEPLKPLHFTIAGQENYRVMPYWQVPHAQEFTCYPVIELPVGAPAAVVPVPR